MDIEQKLNDMGIKSVKYLESITALELLEQAILFMDELQKLTGRQNLPAVIMVGCLISEAERLNTKYDDMLLADKLVKSFKAMQEYMDKNFIKKEK